MNERVIIMTFCWTAIASVAIVFAVLTGLSIQAGDVLGAVACGVACFVTGDSVLWRKA